MLAPDVFRITQEPLSHTPPLAETTRKPTLVSESQANLHFVRLAKKQLRWADENP